jgi:hypothetical protein
MPNNDGSESAAVNDAEFRASVLVHLKYIREGQDELKNKLDDHIKDDDSRFGQVNQRINGNDRSIAKGIGIAAAVVAMIGVVMYIIDKVRP